MQLLLRLSLTSFALVAAAPMSGCAAPPAPAAATPPTERQPPAPPTSCSISCCQNDAVCNVTCAPGDAATCSCRPCAEERPAVCECVRAAPDPSDRVRSLVWVPVPFEVGLVQLPEGDELVIEKVHGTRAQFVDGGEYRVRGRYRLASREGAQIALWNMDGVRDGGPNTLVVRRGSGRFDFRARIVKLGYPHVSLYPLDGGTSFGSVYFGTGDSVWRKPFGSRPRR